MCYSFFVTNYSYTVSVAPFYCVVDELKVYLRLIGNSSTAAEGSRPGRRRPELFVVAPTRRIFFRASFTFFHIHSIFLTFFLRVFVFFNSCCAHARVLVRALVMISSFPIVILKGSSRFAKRVCKFLQQTAIKTSFAYIWDCLYMLRCDSSCDSSSFLLCHIANYRA